MKTCYTCKEQKVVAEFNKNVSKADGLQPSCRLCQREKANKNYHEKYKEKHLQRKDARRKKIKDWLVAYKKSQSCKTCRDSRWYVLDFHHRRDVEKNGEVADMVHYGYGLQKIKDEIEKCDVLCANCHRELHHIEGLDFAA